MPSDPTTIKSLYFFFSLSLSFSLVVYVCMIHYCSFFYSFIEATYVYYEFDWVWDSFKTSFFSSFVCLCKILYRWMDELSYMASRWAPAASGILSAVSISFSLSFVNYVLHCSFILILFLHFVHLFTHSFSMIWVFFLFVIMLYSLLFFFVDGDDQSLFLFLSFYLFYFSSGTNWICQTGVIQIKSYFFLSWLLND